MRFALLIVLAACGRISFGEQGVASHDAAPDVIEQFCANASGHDEDGDGFDDKCDVCPTDPDDQTDSDGDGVGDACDPDPGNPNSLVVFETNNDEATAIYFDFSGDTTAHSFPGNGKLRLSNPDGFNIGEAWFHMPSDFRRIEVAFTVLSANAFGSSTGQTSLRFGGVWYALVQQDEQRRDSLAANIAQSSSDQNWLQTLKEEHVDQSQDRYTHYDYGDADPTGHSFHFVVTRTPTSNPTMFTDAFDGDSLVTTDVGTVGYLQAEGLTIDFDYLAVWK
ncbi:MAG: hypothetical protein QM831_16235 [Kofleriaceae bacterium]